MDMEYTLYYSEHLTRMVCHREGGRSYLPDTTLYIPTKPGIFAYLSNFSYAFCLALLTV